ncbi:MAG TPA: superoxide dismutase family protein [Terriglobales bacterium]|nr:superoxide dismutase family protein [Terriglobales bacterium]
MARIGLLATAIALSMVTSLALADEAKDDSQYQLLVQMKDAKGQSVGVVRLHETPQGVLMHADFTGLPKGPHAFHIHEVGKCEPPFDSAGGHYNPDNKGHGFANAKGAHAGDLPNIHVPESGKVTIEVIARDVQLRAGNNKLTDGDGSALVVHASADDNQSDPAGNAGARIACGVISAEP